jgi:hypothetical protein
VTGFGAGRGGSGAETAADTGGAGFVATGGGAVVVVVVVVGSTGRNETFTTRV